MHGLRLNNIHLNILDCILQIQTKPTAKIIQTVKMQRNNFRRNTFQCIFILCVSMRQSHSQQPICEGNIFEKSSLNGCYLLPEPFNANYQFGFPLWSCYFDEQRIMNTFFRYINNLQSSVECHFRL